MKMGPEATDGVSSSPRNVPEGVIRPILFVAVSVNQRLLSGPVTIPTGPLWGVGMANSVTTPAVVIRPILFATTSVNHRFPSGPGVIETGPATAVGIAKSLVTPAVVIRPI